MITLKKIRSLKPRVQLRKAADVFHEANIEEADEEYLKSVLDIIISSDLVDAAAGEKLCSYFQKGRGGRIGLFSPKPVIGFATALPDISLASICMGASTM